MRRKAFLGLIGAVALSAGVLVLTGVGAAGSHAHARPVVAKQRSAASAPAPLSHGLNVLAHKLVLPAPSGPQRPSRVPHINIPPIQGYNCEVAGGGPCGKPSCTVYAAPSATSTVVGPGRLALPEPMTSAPCAKQLAQQVPVMAR